MKAITVCVEYDDLLAITLPWNAHAFDHTMIVTSWADKATYELVEKMADCGLAVTPYRTDAFFDDDCSFNKGKAVVLLIKMFQELEEVVILSEKCLTMGQSQHPLNILTTFQLILAIGIWIIFDLLQ